MRPISALGSMARVAPRNFGQPVMRFSSGVAANAQKAPVPAPTTLRKVAGTMADIFGPSVVTGVGGALFLRVVSDGKLTNETMSNITS